MSALLNRIEEVRQLVYSESAVTLGASKEYTDASVERLRIETDEAIDDVRGDYADDIKNAIETLDASVVSAIDSEYAQVTSEYQAADAAIKGELLEKIAAGDASVAESLNSRIDNEVSTLAASFEDRIRESESALNEAIATGDASLNIEIN